MGPTQIMFSEMSNLLSMTSIHIYQLVFPPTNTLCEEIILIFFPRLPHRASCRSYQILKIDKKCGILYCLATNVQFHEIAYVAIFDYFTCNCTLICNAAWKGQMIFLNLICLDELAISSDE